MVVEWRDTKSGGHTMKKISALLLLLATPAFAAENNAPPPASLFFTPSETHEAERLAAHEAPTGAGDIRLGAIMYYGPQDWSLWLQGEKWTPETSRDDLHILQVSPNDVHLSWRDDEKGETHLITLHPNESYQIATGKTIFAP